MYSVCIVSVNGVKPKISTAQSHGEFQPSKSFFFSIFFINYFFSFSRACPECRVTSNYVCPSLYYVDTKEEKDLLLSAYKGALGQQNCKYFNKVFIQIVGRLSKIDCLEAAWIRNVCCLVWQGLGTCKFGNKCFYAHRLANGTLVDVGEPHQRRRLDINGDSDFYQVLYYHRNTTPNAMRLTTFNCSRWTFSAITFMGFSWEPR